ncbi:MULTISPECIES: hypothetical protein [unclassified Pseudomonas]|uniref:hypothetical protein n=1 Tax=unclassified Pseudomonas TaxID=196821 RepID=UPI000CD030EC|nr:MULTISPECIES: hypothetical protein [unclassified Pseudomonas]POA52237.1 hypothetical protein C1889_23765 [Pseudomonas sp. FW507-12TSA]
MTISILAIECSAHQRCADVGNLGTGVLGPILDIGRSCAFIWLIRKKIPEMTADSGLKRHNAK